MPSDSTTRRTDDAAPRWWLLMLLSIAVLTTSAPCGADTPPFTIDHVAFDDVGSAVHVVLTGAQRVHIDDVRASLDSRDVIVDDLTSFPLPDERWATCLTLLPDVLPASSDFADLALSVGAERARWHGRAWSPFFVGWSHYDYALRPTSVEREGDRLRIGLYNESNALKPLITIERVIVNGVDVTADCSLPDVLPADRGEYDADERFVTCPVATGDRHRHEITVHYRLVEAEPGRGIGRASADDTLTFIADDRLRQPIGGADGPDLLGTVSLNHEGLRGPEPIETLAHRAAALRRSDPATPIVAHLANDTDIDRMTAIRTHCDLISTQPPAYLRNGFDGAISGWFDDAAARYEATRGSTITMILEDPAHRLDPGDVEWLATAALATGSNGLLFRNASGAPDSAAACHEMMQREIAIAVHYRDTLRLGHPTAPVVASDDGIRANLLAIKPDEFVIAVVNEWCSRATPSGQTPFGAQMRKGQGVKVDLGPDLEDQILVAREMRTGRPLRVRRFGTWVGVELPDFDTGLLVKLETRAKPELVMYRDKPAPRVVPTTAPFLCLGGVLDGNGYLVRIGVRNNGDAPVELDPVRTNEAASAIEFEPCVVAPGAEATLIGSLESISSDDHILTYDVVDASTREPLFPLSVGFDAQPVVSLSPTYHVWSPIGSTSDFRTVTVRPMPGIAAHIVGVTSSGVEVDHAVVDDGLAIRYRPRPTELGRFDGTLTVDVAVAGRGVMPLTLRFDGDRTADYVCTPSAITFVDQGRAKTVTMRIARPDGAQFELIDATAATGVDVTPSSDGASARHTLTITVDPDRHDGAPLTLALRAGGGNTSTITLPIRAVSLRRAARANTHDPLEARARAAVHAAQMAPWDDTPPWVRFHALLMLPPHGAGDDAQTARRDELLRGLLEVDGDVLFTTRHGGPFPRTVGLPFRLEDHRDQYLHIFARQQIPLSTTLAYRGTRATIADLLAVALHESRLTGDLSWSAPALTHYAGASWLNKFGETLTAAHLARTLLDSTSPTCGGAHRLTGLALLSRAIENAGDAELRRLKTSIDDELNRQLDRIRDSRSGTPFTDLETAGHALEWIALSAPESQLREAWILGTVSVVVDQVEQQLRSSLHIDPNDTADLGRAGALSHAVAGLRLWLERIEASEGGVPTTS